MLIFVISLGKIFFYLTSSQNEYTEQIVPPTNLIGALGEQEKGEQCLITKEKAKQIIGLAEGMTHAEWSRINHIIENGFETQEAKLTFEPPKELDLLLKQNFIP